MKERATHTEVREITPLGYGNPEASISYVKQKESGELPDELEHAAVEIITSGECMVDITETDDGCIDGRTVIRVTYVDLTGEVREVQAMSDDVHERYKVAGGGYMTSLAMEFAFHPPLVGVDVLLKEVAATLAEHELFCGMHSGDRQAPELGSTDCGANDKVLPIFGTSVTYKREIADSTSALLSIAGALYSDTAQQYTQSNWNAVTASPDAFESSTGRSRYETVMEVLRAAQTSIAKEAQKPLAVIKHLQGDHKEDFIIINYVPGRTFSQAQLRRRLKEKYPDAPDEQIPQAFVVDVPRIIELAEIVAKRNTKLLAQSYEGDDIESHAFSIALQAGISYQLATAATLTDGSLRTFIVT